MSVQQVLITLSPFDWMKKDLILTNSSGVHSKKAGEFGLMSHFNASKSND